MMRYYAYGIFRGEQHPFRKRFWHKHNPLQALSYLGLKLVVFPVLWMTGLAYLLYSFWSNGPLTTDALEWVALTHTAAAFAMVFFIIVHVYMLTTGSSLIAHVKPMITGYDQVDLTEIEERYLLQDEPDRIQKKGEAHE